MNHERSKQMMVDGLRGFYRMMQRLDGRELGELRSEECSTATACIAYSILDDVAGGDPRKLVGLIGHLMNHAKSELINIAGDGPASVLKGD